MLSTIPEVPQNEPVTANMLGICASHLTAKSILEPIANRAFTVAVPRAHPAPKRAHFVV